MRGPLPASGLSPGSAPSLLGQRLGFRGGEVSRPTWGTTRFVQKLLGERGCRALGTWGGLVLHRVGEAQLTKMQVRLGSRYGRDSSFLVPGLRRPQEAPMLTRPPATLRPRPSPPPPRKPADAASNARELLFAQVLTAAEALPSHPPHEKPPGRGLTEREDGRLWLLRRVHLGTRWPQPGPGTRRLLVGLVGGWKGRPPACDYGAVTTRGSSRRAGPGAPVSHAPRSGQTCPGQAPAALS